MNKMKEEKYESLNTAVADIIDKRGQIILVKLDIYNDDKYIDTYDIELDLKKMNLNQKMSYEFTLAKDLNRVFLRYYYNYKKLPTSKYIKRKMEEKNYLLISFPAFEILKDKTETFNSLCGDWDFRNIDMLDSHLAGITIKSDNTIHLDCEIYSADLDEYYFCSGGNIKSKKLVETFKKLDLKERTDVLDFISELNDKINWKDVDRKLYNLVEKNQKKVMNQDEEEEYDVSL